jgi:hypothetical protein
MASFVHNHQSTSRYVCSRNTARYDVSVRQVQSLSPSHLLLPSLFGPRAPSSSGFLPLPPPRGLFVLYPPTFTFFFFLAPHNSHLTPTPHLFSHCYLSSRQQLHPHLPVASTILLLSSCKSMLCRTAVRKPSPLNEAGASSRDLTTPASAHRPDHC